MAGARCARAWVGSVVTLMVMVGEAHGSVSTPAIHSHEAAFAAATVVARGDIVAYDGQRGATLRVGKVVRGNVTAGADYLLDRSAGVASLAALPRDVTAFGSRLEGRTLHLWQDATNGGLITSDAQLLEQIGRAHADPRAALGAPSPRERLAGAYFLSRGQPPAGHGAPTPAEVGTMVESAAWGLAQDSAPANQAALDTLTALGHPLPGLGIAYHPYFKIELKREAAQRLMRWWAQRR